MKNDLLKKLKIFIKKIIVFFSNHKVMPLGLKNDDIQYENYTFIEL